MQALSPKLTFKTISTALLLSMVAFPISVIVFAVMYASDDRFWTVLWMVGVLPTIWAAAAILGIRDAVKRRSWRQLAGVVVLLAPTALLVHTIFTPRFAVHQLFTFRPLDLHLPINGAAFIQKFSVCAQTSPCTPHDAVTETKTFRLTRVPNGCCLLQVVNGHDGAHKVKTFRVVLNGKEVNLPSDDSLQIATVKLAHDNEVSVQLSGTTDAYIYIVVSYTGKKESPPA
jgi:hypothetical protein